MCLLNISTCDSLGHELLVGRNDQALLPRSRVCSYPLITLTTGELQCRLQKKKKKEGMNFRKTCFRHLSSYPGSGVYLYLALIATGTHSLWNPERKEKKTTRRNNHTKAGWTKNSWFRMDWPKLRRKLHFFFWARQWNSFTSLRSSLRSCWE